MSADLIERLVWITGVLLTSAGVIGAWTSGATAKRLAGVIVAIFGAALSVTALGASVLAAAALAAAFAYLTLGVALLVRLQETYGVTDARTLDQADAANEPPERQG